MQKVARNTLLYTIGQIVPKAAGFILLPIYTRYLTPEDFGIVSSMVVLQAILAVFFSLCLDRSIMRLYWDHKAENERKDFLGTITLSIVMVSFIFLFLIFSLNKYIDYVYKSIPFFPFFAFAIFFSFLSSYSLVPKKVLMLKQRAGIYTCISIIQFFLNAGFILWWIIVKQEGAIGYLKGNVLSVLVMLPIFLYISLSSINLKFKPQILKSVFSFSLPIIPAILTAWILNLSDRIFIEHYFTLTEVGIYSLGYKIAGLVILFTAAFGMAYEPEFFRLANSKNQDTAKRKIFKYNHVYLLGVILICLIVSFFSKEFITLLFNEKYRGAYYFIPLISFSYLFSQAGGITSRYFKQSKQMMANMYIAISAAIMNIILNFILIPRFGPFGAAYATILSMALPFLLSYWYTKKYCYFVPIDWKQIIPLVLIGIFLIVLFEYVLVFDIITSLAVKSILVFGVGSVLLKIYHPQIRLIFAKT